MGRCVCWAWLFRRRSYNQVQNNSISLDHPDPLQAEEKTPQKPASEAPIESPEPIMRSNTAKDSGIYVFRKDSVQLVTVRSNISLSHDAPVIVSEDKIATVRKRLASM